MYADLDRLERTRPRCDVCGKVQYVSRERAMFKAVFLAASGRASRLLVPFHEHGSWHLGRKNTKSRTPAYRAKRRRMEKRRRERDRAREEQA